MFRVLELHHEHRIPQKNMSWIFYDFKLVWLDSHLKKLQNYEGLIKNPPVKSISVRDWRVSYAYVCTTLRWCKNATGAKTVTRWSTFSKNHFFMIFVFLVLRLEPSTTKKKRVS